MSADSTYSGDWNSCLTGSQMNAWNLEDDITRIGSKAEDYLSGIWSAERSASTGSRWKTKSDENASDPFRRFQTSPPNRISPTPLADLYSQSISQAEVESDAWDAENHPDYSESSEDDCYSQSMKEVEFMPQDLFSFSGASSAGSSLESLNRSRTSSPNDLSFEDAEYSSEEFEDELTPKLLAETPKKGQIKNPLLSLSVGMSICGVGLVFGAQIMHNATVINPGKSLIIAGLIGLFVSGAFQVFKRFGRRKKA